MIEESSVSAQPVVPAPKGSLADQLRSFANDRDWGEYALLTVAATRLEYLEGRQGSVTSGRVQQIVADLELGRLLDAARIAISTFDTEVPGAHSWPAVQTLRSAVADIERRLASTAVSASRAVARRA